jgi:hypothetical protein
MPASGGLLFVLVSHLLVLPRLPPFPALRVLLPQPSPDSRQFPCPHSVAHPRLKEHILCLSFCP